MGSGHRLCLQSMPPNGCANHLEALSHCPVSRSALAAAARQAGVADRLRIPADGEVLELELACIAQ